jgi:succinate dehydrogenase flavin-adding protein (antitoxin of CptAB toxin-antitoxin module)
MKTYIKEKLERMTDEEREEFLDGLDKKTIFEMAEGKPKQDMDIKGEVVAKIISVDE